MLRGKGSYPFLALRFLLKLALRERAGVNFNVREAAIFTASPVRGLRPLRAARSATLNLPKPKSEYHYAEYRLV